MGRLSHCSSHEGRGREVLTVKQVAERLGVSADTVYALCQARKLAHVRVGVGRGHIRVTEEALAASLSGAAVGEEQKPRPRPAAPPVRLKHLRS
jgi:excisionase family DNA binding protein